MPETRRELFRTSVVAAIGVSAGALAGYAVAEALSPKAVVPPGAGSVVVVRGNNNGPWYFFNFEQDSSFCRLYKLPATPTPANISAVDTATWFAVSSPARVNTDTTITYMMNDGTTGTIQVNLDANLYLKSGSLSNLLTLMTNENFSQIAGSWNEIGKA